MSKEAHKSIADLLAVMAALRTPGSGCPWDLEQNFKTIAPYTIEEAYEVADAIERGDMGALEEELGDLLLQVVYHARMAEEERAFAFADVVDAIATKMIRRHPHVFGTEAERAAGAAPGFWERIKAEERASQERRGVPSPIVPEARLRHDVGEGQGGGDGRTFIVGIPPTPNPSPPGGGEFAPRQSPSVPSPLVAEGILDDVPVALPALTRAVKLQSKAAKVGFDWPSLTPVFDKLKEELAELEQAVAIGDADAHKAKIGEEFGDLLFVVANVARHLKVDPEASLRAANQKFMRRFRRIEELLAALGRTPAQSTLAEMDRLWDQAKAEERDVPSPRTSRGEG
jgi:ATP diphosphatase